MGGSTVAACRPRVFATAYSPAALLTVCTPPSITQQPVSQPGKQVGDQVTFSVTVAPEVTAPVNYQWQRSDNGGTTWYSAPGASTSSSYTFIVAGGDGNAQFKCYITNGCGQLYSTAVNIGVCTAVAITSNPSPQNVTAGNAASFTVAATGVSRAVVPVAVQHRQRDHVEQRGAQRDVRRILRSPPRRPTTTAFTSATCRTGAALPR